MFEDNTAAENQSLVPVRLVSRTDALQRGGSIRHRAERAVNEWVVAEIFLIQATIESAAALGESAAALGDSLRTLRASQAKLDDVAKLGEVAKQTAPQLVEPYKRRFQALKELRQAVREQQPA